MATALWNMPMKFKEEGIIRRWRTTPVEYEQALRFVELAEPFRFLAAGGLFRGHHVQVRVVFKGRIEITDVSALKFIGHMLLVAHCLCLSVSPHYDEYAPPILRGVLHVVLNMLTSKFNMEVHEQLMRTLRDIERFTLLGLYGPALQNTAVVDGNTLTLSDIDNRVLDAVCRQPLNYCEISVCKNPTPLEQLVRVNPFYVPFGNVWTHIMPDDDAHENINEMSSVVLIKEEPA